MKLKKKVTDYHLDKYINTPELTVKYFAARLAQAQVILLIS